MKIFFALPFVILTIGTGHALEAKSTMTSANGQFEVTLTPQEDASHLTGRMTIDKSFKGDLEGTSTGQMLSWRGQETGTAGYVAIEKVTGKLAGRNGSFVLQHNGTMTPTEQSLTVSIIPGSGTEELTGITGQMSIDIKDGQHFYELTYSFAE